MFDIVYIILVFENPNQIKKLVSSLNAENVFFYLHVDKKIDQLVFEKSLSSLLNVNYHFIEDRNEISWGDNMMVKSILNLIKIVNLNHKNGYCILLSNNDYPIKSNSSIRNYLLSNYGNSFISMAELPAKSYIYQQRLTYYKFDLSKNKKDLVLIPSIWDKSFYTIKSFRSLFRALNSLQYKKLYKILVKRKHPKFIDKIFWGSSYWALPIQVTNQILSFCDTNKNFVGFHKETFISDELFFQTILHHLNKIGKIDTVFNVRCTYMNFEEGNSSPDIIRSSDFEELSSLPNRFLFARKFDSKIDDKIFELIDSIR